MILRKFIHFIGAVVFMIGVGLIAFFIVGYLGYGLYRHQFVFGLIVGTLLFALIGGLIARIGWHIFRRWNNGVVAEYADIQAFMTGIALGKIAGLFWPRESGIAVGFLAFLLMRQWLRRLLLRVLGMPGDHSRRGVEMAMGNDTVGTPWQNNPDCKCLKEIRFVSHI